MSDDASSDAGDDAEVSAGRDSADGAASRRSGRMGREELLDLAGLQALALLGDEALEEEFKSAFDAADPRLQREVLERQAEWASEAAFLSEESPPAALRDRVLASRPLAVGVGVGGGEDDDGTWLGDDAIAGGAAAPPRGRDGDGRDRGDGSLRSSRFAAGRGRWAGGDAVSRERSALAGLPDAGPIEWRSRVGAWLWRAAALALAAGLAVSIWFQAKLLEQTSAIAGLAVQRGTEEKFRSLLGVEFDRFLSGRVEVVGLVGTGAGGGVATLHLDPVRRDGLLVVIDLPRSEGPYSLRLVSGSGEASTVLESIEPAGSVAGFLLADLSALPSSGGRWEMLDAAGEVVLLSNGGA